MSLRRTSKSVAILAAVLLGAVACGGSTDSTTSAGASKPDVKVGLIYSKTGLLQSYGEQYEAGFKVGLDYVTKGTGKINGHKLVVSYNDDAGDPAKAVSIAKDLIGQGYAIIGGSASSGVATQVAPLAAQNKVLFVSGAAASDAITAINRYTFRSGRQSIQDVLTAKAMLQGGANGKKVLVFAQDSAFGQGNFAAVKALIGADGATVTSLLVPLSANDFTPFALQAKAAKPDLIFVAWAGTTAQAMWTALDQQGVFAATAVVTGLDQRASYATFGPVAGKIQFLSHYIYQAPNNAANTYLVNALKKDGKTPDIFNPDGFVTAQLIAHAVDKADGDQSVDKMISALEGYSFLAPKGQETVRAQDHALLQPMFVAKLTQTGSTYESEVLKTLAPNDVAPPVKPMGT